MTKKQKNLSELIIFVGQSGAGKTTIADAIGCKRIASCDILREEVANRGLEDNHTNIHAVALDLISQDPAWQAKKVLKMVKDNQLFIFDGPRNPADIQFLMKSGKKIEIIGICSPRTVRYQRVLEREKRLITKEQFMQRCVDEVIWAGLNNCLSLATVYVFNNNNSLEQIHRTAVSLIAAIQSKDFPKVNPTFQKGMLGFEKFINTLSVPFANSERMCMLMREYFNWEKEQLKSYQRKEIPLEKFFI
ncbi:MAG: AAA family ATPase [Candidatus Nealsonbacteria bacterium]|nr:AAA family ATPase [Candidatus Nealsonbacteria bacterium]